MEDEPSSGDSTDSKEGSTDGSDRDDRQTIEPRSSDSVSESSLDGTNAGDEPVAKSPLPRGTSNTTTRNTITSNTITSNPTDSPLSLTRRSAMLGGASLGLAGLGVGMGTASGRGTGVGSIGAESLASISASVSMSGTHTIGRGARARHPGAVVIGDSTAAEIGSRGPDEVRSQMPIYAPAFHTTSTQAAKTDIEPVDCETVLDGVRSLPIYRWRFTDLDDGHHVGPMAEDFHDRFELDQSGETIASVDADGIAMAAIQGLLDRYETARERLEDDLQERRERVAALESRLDALETEMTGDGGQ